MIHAAIFDMDGLLFDTERLCRDAWQNVARENGYEMDDSLFLACVGRNSRDTRDHVLNELGAEFPYERFTLLAGAWMRARMEESGPPEKPGARRILEYLAERGIPVALATSTSEKSARWMIERAAFTRFFSAFAFGSEVARGKPSPDIFLLAKARLGDPNADRCVVFEDSPPGLRAAHSAGMLTVFVPDLVPPTPELTALVWKTIPSLNEALSGVFLEEI
jgi:HAD superfamily hydrolase (TIGR01509 family)